MLEEFIKIYFFDMDRIYLKYFLMSCSHVREITSLDPKIQPYHSKH
jgi:hypothetical protein